MKASRTWELKLENAAVAHLRFLQYYIYKYNNCCQMTESASQHVKQNIKLVWLYVSTPTHCMHALAGAYIWVAGT